MCGNGHLKSALNHGLNANSNVAPNLDKIVAQLVLHVLKQDGTLILAQIMTPIVYQILWLQLLLKIMVWIKLLLKFGSNHCSNLYSNSGSKLNFNCRLNCQGRTQICDLRCSSKSYSDEYQLYKTSLMSDKNFTLQSNIVSITLKIWWNYALHLLDYFRLNSILLGASAYCTWHKSTD